MAFATDLWRTDPTEPQTAAELTAETLEHREKAKARGRREREEIKARLEDEGDIDLAQKLEHCGIPVPLVCTCCGQGKVVETQCRKRWCPACAWTIQRKRIDRFGGAIALMQWPAFLTLTMPNSTDPESVRELRKNWSKMRRRKLIADRIDGGVAAIEITNHGNGWHPHLHAIIDCRWLAIHTPEPSWRDSSDVVKQKCEHAQMELSALWASVQKIPESIVWIERIKGLDRLRYLLKYSVKGSDLIESPDPIGPLIRVIDKSRLISAFGNLHGRTSEMDEDEKPVACCSECGNEKSFLPLDVIDIYRRADPRDRMPVVCFKPGSPSWLGAEL